MNITKKLMVTAGVILQLTTSLCASYNMANWANAFLAFAGGSDPVAAAQYVLANPQTVNPTGALTAAQPNGVKISDELNAVALFMAMNVLPRQLPFFASSYEASDVQAAAQQLIAQAAPVKKQAPVMQQPVSSNVPQIPATQQAAAPSSSWGSLFGGSSSTASSANVQQAVAAAQKADVLAATQNDKALAAIANSGAQGADLYKQYVDQVFDLLQQALNAIPSQADQKEVLNYVQAQVKALQVIPAANAQTSRTLGRMGSKKADKAAKKNGRK